MKISTVILLGVICSLLGGCVSGTIVATGKSYRHLLNKKTTIEDVRKELGNPEWRKSYQPLIPIKDTKEYKDYDKNGFVFVWDGDNSADDAVTALCEVYTRKGPYFDPSRGEGHAMVGFMTLGVGDVLSMPAAIKERSEMGQQYFSKTFWYDASGHFVGCFDGDISKVK